MAQPLLVLLFVLPSLALPAIPRSPSSSPGVATTTLVVVIAMSVLIASAVAAFSVFCYRKRAAVRAPSMAPHAVDHPRSTTRDTTRSTARPGPGDWQTRFPSAESISGPLHFHGKPGPGGNNVRFHSSDLDTPIATSVPVSVPLPAIVVTRPLTNTSSVSSLRSTSSHGIGAATMTTRQNLPLGRGASSR